MKNNIEKTPFTNKLIQVGIVVRDMEKTVERLVSLGIGPFTSLKKPPIAVRKVCGRPVENVALLAKRAQMGPVELELVQPVSGESIQKEILDKHGEGINHLGFFVDDLDGELAKLVDRGYEVISYVKRVDGTGTAYLDTGEVGGVLFELIQRAWKT